VRRGAVLALVFAIAAETGAQTTRPESQPARALRPEPRIEAGAFKAARNGSRLVVMIVIDQLGTDVLGSARPFLGDTGFRRLEREGTSYPGCAYLHACSETGPGHATLATGASPCAHGIVGNDWIDATTAEIVGCVEDRGTKLLSNGDPGASAHRLAVPTLGDAMKVAFGSVAKVAAISMKDRSAILLAGASADHAVWFDRKTGLFTTSTAFVSATSGPAVAWLDDLNRSAPVAARTEIVWEKAGPPEAYAGLPPDDQPAEYPLGGTRALPRTLRRSDAKSGPEWCDWIAYSPAGLELVFAHARFLLAHAGLGRDDVPDYLGVSVSSTDFVGHLFGPDSHEVRDMTIRTDRLLGAFLTHLDEVVGRGRYDVLLSADHGIGPIPEAAVLRGIPAGRVSAEKVKLAVEAGMRERYGPPPPTEHWVAKVLDADLLLNRPLLEARGIPLGEAQDHAARAAARVFGVHEAVAVHAILENTLVPNALHDAMRRAQMRERSVDVYVVPKPWHVFGRTIATHGTPWEYDRRVPLVLAGPGIRKGHRSLEPAAPGSGVVTIAAGLGIGGLAGADHPVLSDAMER
jgi:predicted AlkP superfamily pyrophosphatase or phosphodiesterase